MSETPEQIIQKSPTLKTAVLAGIKKGAKTDAEAVRNYRASRDCIVAALPELRAHFIQELGESNAQPAVTGEQINQAGWTCDGIHEPGSYATCEDCRDACDDLANFYNQMRSTPNAPGPWTYRPEGS